MEKKYFFFDIDGTLTRANTSLIPSDTLETLEQLRRHGHFVAAATGRLQADAISICRAAGIENMVSDGGNGLTIAGELAELLPLPHQECIRLLEELEEKDIPWAISTENSHRRYSKTGRYAAAVPPNYAENIILPDLDFHAQDAIYKVFAACPPQREKEIAALSALPRVRFNDFYFIIEPDDKAAGIRRMMDHFHAPYREVVVFGDGVNDLNMFSPQWFSIAMGNAEPALKERANFITLPYDQGGITHACKKFGWI